MNRRRLFALTGSAILATGMPISARSAADLGTDPGAPLLAWYRLVLELVRHTATYSPPVASRAFAYLGITAYEAVSSGQTGMVSLAGQVRGLAALPERGGAPMDEALVLHAALGAAVAGFFANTGPTGQRAMAAMERQLATDLSAGVDPEIAARSLAYGRSVADHVIDWSASDGGAVIVNMGFPLDYTLTAGPAHWVPTSLIVQQQAPLLPGWGNIRAFTLPDSGSASGTDSGSKGDCGLPPPPDYSEDKGSAFYQEALETYEVGNTLTDEQKLIARFWSDDPMLSPTPPGHWISIALDIIQRDGLEAARAADVLARLGIAIADAFIACWRSKFEVDLLRPVTYIKRVIDKTWEPLLITPPFPEYPSGHSTQSGAATVVLTAIFGEGYAFTDATHADDGMAPRPYSDFWAAAREAAISRLYGGIHFRAAIERGLDQGACVGAHVNALKTFG